MALALKLCPLCSFEAPSVSIILSHLRTVHASDPNFSIACGLDGCATTSKSFSALYSHVYRHHPDIIKKRKELEPILPDTNNEQSFSSTRADPVTFESGMPARVEVYSRMVNCFLMQHRFGRYPVFDWE